MPTYDPTGHDLLGDAACTLEADELREQAAVAEDVLGLSDVVLSGDDADRAVRAVALQLNYQLDSEDGLAVASKTKGDQSVTYREGTDGRGVAIHPGAERIAARLMTDEGWPVTTGVR